MAKGPIVTPQVEAFIASIYEKHEKWKAPEVHNEVSFLLHQRNPKLPPGWPSLSTVQKVLATVRKQKTLRPEDRPWSMGTLNEYPIAPDTIPIVLDVWKFREEQIYRFKFDGIEVPDHDRNHLTIRQAKWVNRLSHLEMPGVMDNGNIGDLSWIASIYADNERISELTCNPLNTFIDDAAISFLEYPYHNDEEGMARAQEAYTESMAKKEMEKKREKERAQNDK